MASLSDVVMILTKSTKLVEKKGSNKCLAEIAVDARKPQSWGCFWEYLDLRGPCLHFGILDFFKNAALNVSICFLCISAAQMVVSEINV